MHPQRSTAPSIQIVHIHIVEGHLSCFVPGYSVCWRVLPPARSCAPPLASYRLLSRRKDCVKPGLTTTPSPESGRASARAKPTPKGEGPDPPHRGTGATITDRPVSRILSRTAIPLGGALLRALPALPSRRTPVATYPKLPSRGLRRGCPDRGSRAGPARADIAAGLVPYLVLLRVGFTLPPPLPPERCALTAPFHPYPNSLPGTEAVCFLWH